MEYLSITVGGFRNLRKTKVQFAESIVSLVSTNNYGKSNFLDAVAFAVRFMNSTPQMRSRMMGDETCMPLVSELANEDFVFQIELHEPSLGEYQFLRYGFSFSWKRDDNTGARIADERIELSERRGGVWASYLKRAKGLYRPSRRVQKCTRKINLDANQLAIDVLTSVDGLEIAPAIRIVREVRYGACYPLNANPLMEDYPLEVEGQENGVFAMSGNDLPQSLYELKNRHPEKYGDFQSIVLGLFPEIEGIDVVSSQLLPGQREQLEEQKQYIEGAQEGSDESIPYRIRDEVYRIFVRSKYLNQPVSISRMSDGTKRVIWLVARVVTADIAGVGCLGVEEIETGIHPRMMRSLLEAVNEALVNTKIILTSHSPYLIQYLPYDSLYVGVPNNEGTATFSAIKANRYAPLADAAYDHGMSTGEYIFALMSASEDEESILKGHLEGAE